MGTKQKTIRWLQLSQYVETYTALNWAKRMIKSLALSSMTTLEFGNGKPLEQEMLINDYKLSNKRILLFSYGGVLTDPATLPTLSRPSEDTLSLLDRLSQDHKNIVIVVDTSSRNTLDQWFRDRLKGKRILLVAEHGYCCSWLSERRESDNDDVGADWKLNIEEHQMKCDDERKGKEFVGMELKHEERNMGPPSVKQSSKEIEKKRKIEDKQLYSSPNESIGTEVIRVGKVVGNGGDNGDDNIDTKETDSTINSSSKLNPKNVATSFTAVPGAILALHQLFSIYIMDISVITHSVERISWWIDSWNNLSDSIGKGICVQSMLIYDVHSLMTSG